MLVLSLRTDKPESEIGLFLESQELAYEKWPAHRQLAESLHAKIRDLLADQKKDWQDIQGVVVYKGPGSFTGLRIGLSVANALAASLEIPIAGTTGQGWFEVGLKKLSNNQTDNLVLPEYGADVHVTPPRK